MLCKRKEVLHLGVNVSNRRCHPLNINLRLYLRSHVLNPRSYPLRVCNDLSNAFPCKLVKKRHRYGGIMPLMPAHVLRLMTAKNCWRVDIHRRTTDTTAAEFRTE